METKKLTIEALFSNSGPFDEDAVVRVLLPFVVIQKPEYEIFFKDAPLSAERKILAYGLAKSLLKHKDLIEDGAITAQEVYEKTGLKKGTIDPNFKRLKDAGLLAGKGEYEIPAYKIKEVIEIISKELPPAAD